MNNFRRQRIIDRPSQVKSLIDDIKRYELKLRTVGRGGQYRTMNELKAFVPDLCYTRDIVVELSETKLKITSKWGSLFKDCRYKVTTYIFDLNEKVSSSLTGQRAFATMQKYFKVCKCKDTEGYEFMKKYLDEETGKYVTSASPLVGYNSKYNNSELHNVYEYDLNSAYSAALMKQIPDLDHPIIDGKKCAKDEVGFIIDSGMAMVDYRHNCIADVKFKLIETPESLKKFLKVYYDKKKTAPKDSQERLDAKLMMNAAIGYTQRWNPFLRAYVVGKCNATIKDIINQHRENIVMWNTDAVFSTIELPELKLSNEIGDFKVESCKTFRIKGNNYQIDDEIPTMRGTPKTWVAKFNESHDRPYNLLTDPIPELDNIYDFDMTTLKLKRN